MQYYCYHTKSPEVSYQAQFLMKHVRRQWDNDRWASHCRTKVQFYTSTQTGCMLHRHRSGVGAGGCVTARRVVVVVVVVKEVVCPCTDPYMEVSQAGSSIHCNHSSNQRPPWQPWQPWSPKGTRGIGQIADHPGSWAPVGPRRRGVGERLIRARDSPVGVPLPLKR